MGVSRLFIVVLAVLIVGSATADEQTYDSNISGIDIIGTIEDADAKALVSSLSALGDLIGASNTFSGAIVFLIGPGAVYDGRITPRLLSGFPENTVDRLQRLDYSPDGCTLTIFESQTVGMLVVSDSAEVGDYHLNRCILSAVAQAMSVSPADIESFTNKDILRAIVERF